MAKKRSILEKMRDNPRDGWTMADIETLCDQCGLEIRKPNGGSHHVVSSPHLAGNVTVPYKRPIKQGYIKALVSYTMAHHEAKRRDEND